MRRSLALPAHCLFLLVPALAFAGDPARIPSTTDWERLIGAIPSSPSLTPRSLGLQRLPVPLSAGPAGQYGTIALPGDQRESSVAASGQIVLVANMDNRGFGIGIARSTDGGATFSDMGVLPVSNSKGDPWLTVWNPPVGPPVFYCCQLALLASGVRGVVLNRSTDGGATWAGPFEVTAATDPGASPDQPCITVDPETGRLLMAWTYLGSTVSIRVSYSDNAATGVPPVWTAAQIVGGRAQDGQASTLITNPTNGEVYLAWMTYPGSGNLRGVGFSRSVDDGTTWSAPADLDSHFYNARCAYGFDRWQWSFCMNSIAWNPADGGLEMVYAASSSDAPTGDAGDIFYRRSVDGGTTWSPPVALNAFPGADRAQVLPCVTAASDGRIDVLWDDQSAGSGLSDLTDLFYCFSTDLGATWSSPVPITPEPFHCESGDQNLQRGTNQGDYNDFDGNHAGGISFASGAVFAPPSPISNGGDPFVFTATGVQVAPLRVRPGSAVVADRGCGIDDGVLVAGEMADVTIPLENIGRGALTGVGAVLTALTPGVSVEAGERSYGGLASGASGLANDVYRIRLAADYSCGVPCRLRLDVHADGVAPSFVEFSLPTGVVASSLVLVDEDFDGVVPPALPSGWSTTTVHGAYAPWRTTTASPASAPNAAYVEEPLVNSFERLMTPLVFVPAGTDYLEITFDVRYDLYEWDSNHAPNGLFGNLLIGALDPTGGGQYLSGNAIEMSPRYNHNVDRASGSAGDHWAWSGANGAYEPVRVLIPAEGGGASVSTAFDLTTTGFGRRSGAWVDNVRMRALGVGCGGCVPTATPLPDSPRSLAFQVSGANPFHGNTSLRYSLPERAPVRLEVFHVTGQRVRMLVMGWKEPGTYTTDLGNGSDGARTLAPGVYLVRLTAGTQSRTLRLVTFD